MFCPKCSQHQFSGDVRFCSRCGFQLSAVRAVLFYEESPFTKFSASAVTNQLQRKKDMIIGAMGMCLLALHSAWTTEDLSLEREYTSLIVKCFILCVLITVLPKVLNYFRRSKMQENSGKAEILSGFNAGFIKDGHNPAFPSAYSRAAGDYFTAGIKTAEFIVPRSVTEETTNLLGRDTK